MKRSRAITLTLLSASMLAGCRGSRAPDRTWYDATRAPIAEQWVTDPAGHRIPATIPHDRYGRPWVRDADGEWNPLPPPAGPSSPSSSSSYRRSSGGFWPSLFGSSGSSGYRSSGSPAGASVSRGGFGSHGSAIGSSSS